MTDHTCTFVPPYLMQRLLQAAAPQVRQETLVVDERMRERRTRPRQTLVAATSDAGRRLIHTAGNTETLPGTVVRREGEPDTGDAAADESYASSGAVWDLYAEAFGRQSFDGNGSTISVTVHYGEKYDNAFWDGEQLVFGDGDGQIFDRFTKPMDVLCHEFSHGFVQYTTAFTYQGQAGALNESIADVFASMAKQRDRGQTVDQADWLIGEGLFLPGVQAKALRSMTEPGTAYDDDQLGKDPQVGSMADYVDTTDDNGGVHINSGIPNRAFALAAIGMGGNSWERAGKVWYDAMTSGEVGSEADFAAFAQATLASAQRVFADDPSAAQQVELAWQTVGVMGSAASGTSSPAGGTPDPGTPTDPVPTDPAPTDPAPTDPAPTDPAPEDPAPTDPAPEDQTPTDPIPTSVPRQVTVRRSGGFTAQVRSASVDLDDDPDGAELRSLLRQVDLQQLGESSAVPDRFHYTLSYGDVEVTVPEQDLTPQLSRVVKIVLERSRLTLE